MSDMAKSKPVIDKDTIRELAELLYETGLTEIEVEENGFRLRVAAGGAAATQVIAAAPQAAHAPAQSAGAGRQATAESSQPIASGDAVTSPMVGTAYMAPSPGAKPFIQVGQEVQNGQTLLIIEAMKTMNQIPSPRSGKVAAILVSDGQPVEYDEPLVVLE